MGIVAWNFGAGIGRREEKRLKSQKLKVKEFKNSRRRVVDRDEVRAYEQHYLRRGDFFVGA